MVGSLERRRREKILPSCPPAAIVQPAAGDEKFCPKNVKIYDFCSAAPAVSDEPQGSILRLLDWQKDVDSNMLEPSEVTTGGDTNTPSVTRKERSGSTHARNELRLEYIESGQRHHTKLRESSSERFRSTFSSSERFQNIAVRTALPW